MSAPNFTPIQLYRTATAAATPSAGNLADGELAINLTDEKLYFKNASGVVKLLASNSGSLGSVTSVNASGSTTGLTFTGGPITSSGTLTLGGTLVVGNGGTGSNTAAGARTNLGVPANDGTGATGTWGISVTGNAGNVTGTVAVANGGTGATSLTSGYLVKGNGTSAVSASVVYDNGTNVGIGTTSPGARLDVNGQTVSGNITVRGDGSEGGQMAFYNAANTAIPLALDVDGGGNGRLFTSENNANLVLGQLTGTGGNVAFSTAGSERMRIDSAGNVGIGTSFVAAGRMQVSGQVSDTDGTSLDQGQLFLTDSDNSTSSGLMIGYRWQAGVAEYARIQARNSVGASNLVLQGGGGNVGIGTNTPGQRLDVNGSINAANNLFAGNGSGVWFNGSASFSTGIASSTTNMLFYTSSSERMRIDTSGNVGIGTSTATARLRVAAGGAVNAPVLGNVTNYSAFFSNSDTAYGLGIGTNTVDGHVWLQAQRSDTATAYNLTINEAGGNVGIGTSSPSEKLELANTSAAFTLLRATNTLGYGKFGVRDTGDAFMATGVGKNMSFWTEGAGGGERMRVTSTGNVGIGTSAPNYLLHLNQNGNTQAWISATNAGSNSAGIGLENQGQRNWQIWADRTNDALQFGNNNRAATSMAIKPAGQVRFIPLASAPSGAEAGDVYYDSGTNKLRCYNGTTWNDLF